MNATYLINGYKPVTNRKGHRIGWRLAGRLRAKGSVISENAKTVWVVAPDGRPIKRHRVRDAV